MYKAGIGAYLHGWIARMSLSLSTGNRFNSPTVKGACKESKGIQTWYLWAQLAVETRHSNKMMISMFLSLDVLIGSCVRRGLGMQVQYFRRRRHKGESTQRKVIRHDTPAPQLYMLA